MDQLNSIRIYYRLGHFGVALPSSLTHSSAYLEADIFTRKNGSSVDRGADKKP